MESEEHSTEDSSFETVTEGNEGTPEPEPEELADQTQDKGNHVNGIDESTEYGSDEELLSETHSGEKISEDSTESEEEGKTKEEPDPERIALIEQIQKALQERKEMKKTNKTLQAKLAIFFRTKKIDLTPYDKEPAELEKEYNVNLNDIAKLEKQLTNFESDFKKEVDEYEKILEEREQVLQELTDEFTHLKRSVALRAVDSQSGKRMTPDEVDYYLKQEEQRDKLLRDIRLEYVKHNNALKEAEERMKELDKLPHSANVIEFDQLGVQIQTFFMKIGQREEEIAKFQSRCSNTINILSHYKETLHFVQNEKEVVEAKLKHLEQLVTSMRDQLFILKAEQESTKAESHELQQKFKLLQNEFLLDDFLASKIRFNSLTEDLQKLIKQHSSAMASIGANRNKHSATKKLK